MVNIVNVSHTQLVDKLYQVPINHMIYQSILRCMCVIDSVLFRLC